MAVSLEFAGLARPAHHPAGCAAGQRWQAAQCISAGFTTPAGRMPRGLWTLLPGIGTDKYRKLTSAARVAAGHTV